MRSILHSLTATESSLLFTNSVCMALNSYSKYLFDRLDYACYNDFAIVTEVLQSVTIIIRGSYESRCVERIQEA